MLLSEVIRLLDDYQKENYRDVEISGISYNSLTTNPRDIFICIRGEASDGHKYAKSAVEKGASALFCEEKLDIDVPQIIVKDTKRTMAKIASAFYNEPSKEITINGTEVSTAKYANDDYVVTAVSYFAGGGRFAVEFTIEINNI